MTIEYRRGDLFAQHDITAYAHGCNCRGVMGAGIAAQFRARYPLMYRTYRSACRGGLLTLGMVMPWQAADGKMIYNLMTQDQPGPDARPWAITTAAGQMIQLARLCRVRTIGLPMIGCGIGGLNPEDLDRCLQPFATAPVRLVVVEYAPAEARS